MKKTTIAVTADIYLGSSPKRISFKTRKIVKIFKRGEKLLLDNSLDKFEVIVSSIDSRSILLQKKNAQFGFIQYLIDEANCKGYGWTIADLRAHFAPFLSTPN